MRSGIYRKIDPDVWSDEKFRSLTREGRELWFYVLTGPNGNRIGLYRFSIAQAAEDIGVPTSSIRRLIAEIEGKGMVLFDEKTRLLWIPKWLNYNEPSGLNQILGLQKDVEVFLPHPFARCLHLLIVSRLVGSGGEKSPINKKQAILVRDGCKCVYCGKNIKWMDYEVDHVIPKSREAGGRDRYDSLVASCRDCNRQKGTMTAEEFGFPFVAGREYSLGLAILELVFNPQIRELFRSACGGLPQLFNGIEELDYIFNQLNGVSTALERRSDSETMPFEVRSDGVAAQEQEQEQEQDIYCAPSEQSPSPPPGNHIPYKPIIEYLNQKTGKNFREGKETLRHIRARWNAGYRLEDFQRVIDIKTEQWLTDPKMVGYLRPETLFGTKFDSYLNEGGAASEGTFNFDPDLGEIQ